MSRAGDPSDTTSFFNIISLMWTTLVFGSVIWTVEKLFLQVFAIQFHRVNTHFTRMMLESLQGPYRQKQGLLSSIVEP